MTTGGELAAARQRIAELEQEVEELRCGDLVLFADGELRSEARDAKFRDHLARCEACQHGLADLMALDAGMRALATPRVPR